MLENNKKSGRVVPVGEASKELGISISTLYRYERQKLIKSMRTAGGHRRYSEEELEQFKEKMKSDMFAPKRGRPRDNQKQLTLW